MRKWDTQQLSNYLTLPRGAKTELAFKFRSPPSQVSAPYKRCCCSCCSFPLSLHREQTHIPYSSFSEGLSPGWGIPAPVNSNLNPHPWVKHFAWGDVGQIFISRKCNCKPELLRGAIKGQTNISSLEYLPKAQDHIPPTWNPSLQSSVTQSLVPAGPKDARKETNPWGESGFVAGARSKGIQYKQLINICYLIVCFGSWRDIFLCLAVSQAW